MLLLVFADRDEIGVIEEDVGGLEHRIVEEGRRNGFILATPFCP